MKVVLAASLYLRLAFRRQEVNLYAYFLCYLMPFSYKPQSIVNRGVQKILVRLPTQDPPPDDTSLSLAALKILREAQSIQKTMVC